MQSCCSLSGLGQARISVLGEEGKAQGALCLGLIFRLGWLRACLYTRGMGKSRNTQRVMENTRINYMLLDLEVLL